MFLFTGSATPVTQQSLYQDRFEKPISRKQDSQSVRALPSATTDRLSRHLEKNLKDRGSLGPKDLSSPGSNCNRDPTVRKTHHNDIRVESRTSRRPATSALLNEDPLAEGNLSSLLEKDDSLAERVRSLLEEDSEEKSDGPKQLLRSSDKTGQSGSSDPAVTRSRLTPDFSPLPGGVRDDRGDSTFPGTAEVSSDDAAKNRFVGTRRRSFDFEDIVSSLPRPSDPFGSLNTSKSTEYGDLPDAVDIPADLVKRLNNMRMLDRGHVTKEAWVERSSGEMDERFSSNLWSATPTTVNVSIEAQPVDAPIVSQSVAAAASLSGGLPIAGDVKYHVGSNPVTPQFPVEEESLRQLQTYIESKTGLPAISPLVEGLEVADNGENTVRPPCSANVQLTVVASAGLPKSASRKCYYSSNRTEPKITETLPEVPRTAPSLVLSHKTPDFSAGSLEEVSHVPDVGYDMRREPEGMSPPILTAAAPSRSQALHQLTASGGSASKQKNDSEHSSKQKNGSEHSPQIPNAVNDSDRKEDSSSNNHGSRSQATAENADSVLDQSLADESILARIKSVLTESMSRQKFGSSFCNASTTEAGGEQSDLSLASSVDSLAVHVRALLEDEMRGAAEHDDDDPLQVSNLSEAIENFENTDLWKFVRQFLPSAAADPAPDPSPGPVSAADGLDTSIAASESSLANSLLQRIRAEFKKEQEQSTNQLARLERAEDAADKVVSADVTPAAAQQSCPPGEQPSLAVKTPSLVPDSAAENNPIAKATAAKREDARRRSTPLSNVAASATQTSREGRAVERSLDPIPGIPEFARSVYSPSDAVAMPTQSEQTRAVSLNNALYWIFCMNYGLQTCAAFTTYLFAAGEACAASCA